MEIPHFITQYEKVGLVRFSYQIGTRVEENGIWQRAEPRDLGWVRRLLHSSVSMNDQRIRNVIDSG